MPKPTRRSVNKTSGVGQAHMRIGAKGTMCSISYARTTMHSPQRRANFSVHIAPGKCILFMNGQTGAAVAVFRMKCNSRMRWVLLFVGDGRLLFTFEENMDDVLKVPVS